MSWRGRGVCSYLLQRALDPCPCPWETGSTERYSSHDSHQPGGASHHVPVSRLVAPLHLRTQVRLRLHHERASDQDWTYDDRKVLVAGTSNRSWRTHLRRVAAEGERGNWMPAARA